MTCALPSCDGVFILLLLIVALSGCKGEPPEYIQNLEVWQPIPPEYFDVYVETEGDYHCLTLQGIGFQTRGCKSTTEPRPGAGISQAVGDGTIILVVATSLEAATTIRIQAEDEVRSFPLLKRNGVKIAGILVPFGSQYELLDENGKVIEP